MPMQLEAVLAKRDRAEKEHMPARPPHVFVDGMYVRGQATLFRYILTLHLFCKETILTPRMSTNAGCFYR